MRIASSRAAALVRSELVAIAATLLLGCNPWYLVESEYQGATLRGDPPEITETRVYRRAVRPGVSVAVGAPDRCANQSAGEATGGAKTIEELISTTCGVEMAEVERRLAEAGYRVISWNAVYQMVVYEENVTPLAAAKQLGAEILFQMNSLERSRVAPGQESTWRRSFFESNSKGDRKGVAHVDEARARALEGWMMTIESAVLPREQISVTADATAILVETGEAIWFYRWTNNERFEGNLSTTQLFECNRRNMGHCVKHAHHGRPSVAAGTPRAGGSGSMRSPGLSVTSAEAEYYRLVREVVRDLVSRFGQN